MKLQHIFFQQSDKRFLSKWKKNQERKEKLDYSQQSAVLHVSLLLLCAF